MNLRASSTATFAFLGMIASADAKQGPKCMHMSVVATQCVKDLKSGEMTYDQCAARINASLMATSVMIQPPTTQDREDTRRLSTHDPHFALLVRACIKEKQLEVKTIIDGLKETIKKVQCIQEGCSKG